MVQVVISEYDADPYPYHKRVQCGRGMNDFSRPPEEASHGLKLVEALERAEHGTTIEIAAKCSFPLVACGFDLHVKKSVRLIGTGSHLLSIWTQPLMVRSFFACSSAGKLRRFVKYLQ